MDLPISPAKRSVLHQNVKIVYLMLIKYIMYLIARQVDEARLAGRDPAQNGVACRFAWYLHWGPASHLP